MARAKRHYIPGYVWHTPVKSASHLTGQVTHRCHKREFFLKFAKDRHRYLQWLYQARKRYGLKILNYMVTSNHIHLLVVDNGDRYVIPNSMQLVAGRMGQEFNHRKARKGAYWEDRYHATAVESGDHLARCMVYMERIIQRGFRQAPHHRGGFDMAKKTKIGILLCDHHCVQTQCHGIKCFRALNNREGAFSGYNDTDLELVSYVTCTGCPGGAIGNKVLAELKKIGVETVFLSSGAVCGFPPCPHIGYLHDLTEKAFGMKMVVGTHPIPRTFWEWHKAAGSWDSAEWQEYIKPTTTDEKTREAYVNIV